MCKRNVKTGNDSYIHKHYAQFQILQYMSNVYCIQNLASAVYWNPAFAMVESARDSDMISELI